MAPLVMHSVAECEAAKKAVLHFVVYNVPSTGAPEGMPTKPKRSPHHEDNIPSCFIAGSMDNNTSAAYPCLRSSPSLPDFFWVEPRLCRPATKA